MTEYNVTWCAQIAYQDEDIEVCIRLDESGELITNSTCGAKALGVQDFLSMPSKGAVRLLAPDLAQVHPTLHKKQS